MSKRKRVSIIFALFIFGIIQFTNVLGVTGTITTETIRIREEPSTDSRILEIGNLNEEVEVIGEEGDWYKVNFRDTTGYIHKDYIELEEELPSTTSSDGQEEQNQTNQTSVENQTTTDNQTENQTENNTDNNQETTQTTNSTQQITLGNVLNQDTYGYLLPNITSIRIMQLERGTTVNLITTIANWTKIEVNESEVWVSNNYLALENGQQPTTQEPEQQPEETPEEEQPEETQSLTINQEGYVSSNAAARMRQEPNTDSEILIRLPANTIVTVISEENDWYKVSYNGQEGYISKELITMGTPPAEEPSSRTLEEPRSTDTISNNTSAEGIVSTAQNFLGGAYVSGGTSPSGFDCSGFTQYVYKHFGYSISRTSGSQRSDGIGVSKSNLRAGDIVCFSGHVGIYISNNNFIHAENPANGVTISSLNESYYKRNYITARRIIY